MERSNEKYDDPIRDAILNRLALRGFPETLTMYQLCEMTGLHQTNLTDWLVKKRGTMTLRKLYVLLDALGLRLELKG